MWIQCHVRGGDLDYVDSRLSESCVGSHVVFKEGSVESFLVGNWKSSLYTQREDA
jgi:hypothetical protein